MSLGAQDYERNIWVVFSVRTQRAHFLQVTEGTKSDWRPDLWMVPKCHAVPCNVQEDLGSTLLDGYQSGECRHFLAFHSHYLCYFGIHCKRAEGLQVRRSAAERTGRTPGLPPAKNTSWYNQGDFHRHQPSTPASQPRTCSGLCLREGECGKKKKPKSLGRLSRPESAAAELEGGRPSAESRAPGGGHVRPPATRSRPAVTVPSPPIPTKAVSPAAALTRAALRPHAAPPRSLLIRADPVPVTDSEILGRHLGRQQHSRPQRRPPPEPRGLAPGLPARRRTRPPLLGVGGRGSDDEGHPGREPAAAVKKRRPRPRRSARGSAPRRPHRVPEQAQRRQPGLVAIAASRARRSVP